MSAFEMWKVDPDSIPVAGPGSVLFFVDTLGVLCYKTEAGLIVPVNAGGIVGPQGVEGPQGVPGPQGSQGPQGSTGAPGGAGPQGVPGNAGATGNTGAQGVNGDAGLPGAAGPQGVQGNAGATGNTGAQGVKGDTGLPGAAGPQGVPGNAGATGNTGAQGAAWSPLIEKANSALTAWSTVQTTVLSFMQPDLPSGGAVGFVVHGSNDHPASANNLVIAVKVGGVVKLTQTLGLGSTLKTARAWRAVGRIYYEGGQFVGMLTCEVDAITTQTGVGMGSKSAVVLTDLVEVVVYVSSVLSGEALRCVGGFAYREF